MDQDPAELYEVPERLRFERDDAGPASNALEGGADNDLMDVWANPGEVQPLLEDPPA